MDILLYCGSIIEKDKNIVLSEWLSHFSVACDCVKISVFGQITAISHVLLEKLLFIDL